jgi:hypothetical protein
MRRIGVEGSPDALSGDVRPWSWLAFGILLIGAISVFWCFAALPFMDLPAHAGILALKHRFVPTGFEGHFFIVFQHLGPYSLFSGLGEMFTAWFGANAAVRLLATLPAIALPLAVLWARLRLTGQATAFFGFVGIILSFGFMTLSGFASFMLSLAILLVTLTEWLVLASLVDSRCGRLLNFIVVALLAFLTFIAHGFTFILLLFVIAISVLCMARFWSGILHTVAFAPATIAAAYSLYVERFLGPAMPVAPQSPSPVFQNAFDKISLLITPTLMTRTGIDALTGVLLWLVIIACAVATYRAIRRSDPPLSAERKFYIRSLLYAAAALFVVFLALPHSVGWFGFVDGRLLPLVLLLVLVAIDEDVLHGPWERAVRLGAGMGAAVVVGLVLAASYRFQAEAMGYRDIVAKVPASTRLLNLPLDPNSVIFTSHPFVHYDKLALVERPIVPSDIWFHQGSGIYPTPANPALRLPVEYSSSNLKGIAWEHYRLNEWDYVLIRTKPEAAASDVPVALTLVEHIGGWWLYRNMSATPIPGMAGHQ